MKTYEEILAKWPAILEYIRQNHQISDVHFRNWIVPLNIKDYNNGIIYLSFDDDQFNHYIRKRYGEIIEESCNAILAERDEHYMVSITPVDPSKHILFDHEREHYRKLAPLSFMYCKEN